MWFPAQRSAPVNGHRPSKSLEGASAPTPAGSPSSEMLLRYITNHLQFITEKQTVLSSLRVFLNTKEDLHIKWKQPEAEKLGSKVATP